jgi:hypothetical protein
MKDKNLTLSDVHSHSESVTEQRQHPQGFSQPKLARRKQTAIISEEKQREAPCLTCRCRHRGHLSRPHHRGFMLVLSVQVVRHNLNKEPKQVRAGGAALLYSLLRSKRGAEAPIDFYPQ